MTAVVNWFVRREWRLFVAVASTVLAVVTDGFGQVSDTADQIAGLSLVEALPALAALVTGMNVFSRESVDRIREEVRSQALRDVESLR